MRKAGISRLLYIKEYVWKMCHFMNFSAISVKKDWRVSVKEKSTLTWLRKVTKKYRSFVVLLAIFEIIVSGLGVCYALVMKQMVDRAVAKDSHGFVMGMIGFGLLVLSQLAIRIITRQVSEYTRSSM